MNNFFLKKNILFLSFIFCLFLTACGAGRNSTSGEEGVIQSQPGRAKPYTVMGQTYHPLLSGNGFIEEGIASWYGKDFHGKKTANGERYNMYGMTAAHRILPFGTKVRVTNLQNGKKVVVRVNDRGPFVANRIIDLTQSAASQLGMIGTGTARVRVESIDVVPSIKNGDMKGSFYVQVGAFSVRANADKLLKSIQAKGMKARAYYSDYVHFWRVQIGPFSSLKEVERQSDNLQITYPGNYILAD